MPTDNPSPDVRRLMRIAATLFLAAVTAVALVVVPSDSLRATVVTVLVILGLVVAGWRLSAADDERPEPLPADD